MSIQPSSRLRPSTFGTFLMLVRNILAPSDADVIPVVAFTALAKAAPIFSLLLVTIVLQNLARQAGDKPDAPRRNRWRRCQGRGRRSSSHWRPRRGEWDCQACGRG